MALKLFGGRGGHGEAQSEAGTSGIIINAIADGVVIIDWEGIIRLFNPGAAAISGWTAEEALGLDFRGVLKLVNAQNQPYPDNENPFLASLHNHQTVRDSDAILVTRGNKRIYISLTVSPMGMPPESSGTGSVVAVFRDVSQEKAEEAQRAEFISTASHEMRTPIAAIEGYLALALNDKVCVIDKNARGYLDKAHVATKHLGKLFQDLLTSSRAEDGRLQSYPTVLEMGEILQQATDDARFNAESKGLVLKYVFGSDAAERTVRPFYYVFADQSRIREVIQNLIDNAIKYTLQGGITVRLTGDDNVVQVQVSDSGPGIDAEDIPHLFQKFYRVDSSLTRSVGGTGLGLFICKKIVELYNGRIWVQSEIGKGSTFFINLPRLTKERALQLQKEQAAHMSILDSY